MNRIGHKHAAALLVCTVALTGTAFAAEEAADTDRERVVENAYVSSGDRTIENADRIATEVITVSERQGRRSAKEEAAGQEKTGNASSSPNTDFWFYTADIELFADDDRDGYYHGIDLLFDADTVYTQADVYAVVYLSLDGGPWIEYAETETFGIWGASSSDEYVIVTELLDGFPTGSYDVLIELFDTWDNSFVADLGPEHSSELSFLPLEDAVRDTPAATSPPVVVNRGGGGATDRMSLLVLLLAAASGAAIRRRGGPQPLRRVRFPRERFSRSS